MKELEISVRDVLARPLFKDATILAGQEGLNREVKWAHVLEVQDFESLINGGELILTTGVGLQLDLPTQIKYVKRLIEKEVACICIELGPYFSKVPAEIIELADTHHFPLIAFEKTVKFVDITQDLHTMIINRHHQLLSQLDTLSRAFIDLSLAPNGILKILQELHRFFRQGVLFIGDQEKSYYYPSEMKEIESVLVKSTDLFLPSQTDEHIFTINRGSFACVPVRGLGQQLGLLCMEIKQPETDEMCFLILDRASLAIAQVLLRNRTIAERKQKSEGEFVRSLINGRPVDQDEIHSFLPTPSRNMYYRVFTIDMDDLTMDVANEDWEEIRIQRSMMIRALFHRNGFFPAVSSVKNEIVIIASFLSASESIKEQERFLQVLAQIDNINHPDYLQGNHCTYGLSTVYQKMDNIRRGYEESRKVLQLRKSKLVQTYFHEDLGLYRLLSELNGTEQLTTYISDYLSPVLNYDREMDSDLYETLRVYLECGGSKKETADRLFIVRQTLYHRLDKLESLLGDDFMEPTKRLSIEVAIQAYKLTRQCHEHTKSALQS